MANLGPSFESPAPPPPSGQPAARDWRPWRTSRTVQKSVASVAASDAEVRNMADDRLNFAGLARGISRFLRNTETRPPLTLAITGDWGSGKSSLMRLVCADLRRFGHRPIWFNAWHHQKEEHLFAALLGAVHAQAVPPWFAPNGSGLLFRLRLLWLRSQRHFGVMLVMVALVSGLLALSWEAFQRGGIQSSTQMLLAIRAWAAPQVAGWTGLVAALTALAALFKGTKAFGVNPALLLTQVRNGMRLKTAAAQNDFRAQFAQQFGELVQALPYRLVLVIDDLDRCRPTAMLDVMEAVNYLTSAGDCFVLFGMASTRVQAALGLAFKDIAAELVYLEEKDATPDDADADTDAEATDPALVKRRKYAADYLQKLVNIEIKVPQAQSRTAHRLLQAAAPAPRRRLRQGLDGLWRLWPLAVFGAAVGTGVGLARQLGASLSASQAAASPAPAPAASEPHSLLPWLALALLPLLAVGAASLLRRLRSTLMETRDSQKFQDALQIWAGVVAEQRPTPRAIKRFGNRLRYLAMLQQGEAQDATWLDLLQAAWQRPAAQDAATEPPPEHGALAEHQLIAIGAWYEIFGPQWHNKIASQPTQAIRQAVQQHQDKFNTRWPPSDAELAVFERLVSGVRLAGDPLTIAPSARSSGEDSPPDDGMARKASARKAAQRARPLPS